MAQTPTDVYNYLQQTLHAGIAGVKTAPVDPPTRIVDADLPVVLTLIGPAEYTFGQGFVQEDRQFRVVLLLDAVGAGQTLEKAYTKALGWHEKFVSAYANDPNLGGNATQALLTDDAGVVNWEYAGKFYVGILFGVRVTMKRGV